jgi:VWFA-related protein
VNSIRVLFVVILLTTVVPLPTHAQQQPKTEPALTITSRSGMVTVPVVVLEKNARVSGLKKEDFDLREDGKNKAVAAFEEIKTTPGRLNRAGVASGSYSNEITGTDVPKRLTIFALDLVNTPFLSQSYAREQLIKYLANRLDSREPTALVSIRRDGITVLHDFSSDPAVLVAALKKVSGELPGLTGINPEEINAEVQELTNFQGAVEPYVVLAERQAIMVTLESFQHVAEAFAGVPGRKSLIWATSSFPFGLDPVTGIILSPRVFSQGSVRFQANTLDSTGGLPALPTSTEVRASEDLRALEPLYQRTFQMLNDANIAVYPVDARGLVVFFPGADAHKIDEVAAFNEAIFESTRQTMLGFAEMTGGKAFYNRNDLDVAFQKAAEDSSSYYMLSYYLDKNAKPGWHKLQVRLKNAKGEVRARNGFFVTEPPKRGEAAKMDLKMATVSPLPYTALPLSVRWTGTQAVGSKKKVHFQINLPPAANIADVAQNNLVNLDVIALATTPTAKIADQFSQHVETNLQGDTMESFRRDGLNYSNDVIVPPGEYSARFVVRDNLTGRLGSVIVPLKVAQ